MITVILLMVIYMAFISLGLPDAVFGVAWPLIRTEWVMDLKAGGLIATVTTIGTVASSLLSGRLIAAFGEGKIAFFSTFLTAAALLGFGVAPHYGWIIFLAVPLGFGAGSVDTALNHFVATHFRAHHMNWLHACWGIGATAGPLVMSAVLMQTQSWRAGFRTIAYIQFALAALLLVSLPLWRKHQDRMEFEDKKPARALAAREVFRTKGAPNAMLVFLFYCGGEYAMGLWGASYLLQFHGISLERAAQVVALYYGGITFGRLLAGGISFKLNNSQLIKWGVCRIRQWRDHADIRNLAHGGIFADRGWIRPCFSCHGPRNPHSFWDTDFPNTHWVSACRSLCGSGRDSTHDGRCHVSVGASAVPLSHIGNDFASMEPGGSH
ncbi:MFS transporter [Anoxynatronum buryatiense]|uniref:Major Facilitator Superfamily protein n=1 Tax=Anoxynatronum buryatiense TaxID=489973 RepID=A0AA46AIN0_9CLOT|nr:MFS transporter [Anoxynatronum buryatiense]SMP52118.1 Major Facilitator Superfamily protein [Anoxynatronum buryatiense]